MNVRFFSDHCIIFVIGIICITKLAIRSEFELQELMTEFSFMANIVPQIKVPITTHFQREVCFDAFSSCTNEIASVLQMPMCFRVTFYFVYSVYSVSWLVYSKQLPCLYLGY